MTRLVVVGTSAGDDASDVTPVDGLAEALARQARSVRVPVGDVSVVKDLPGVRAALVAGAAAGEPVGLVAADLVCHPSVLGDALDDPRRPVGALVLDDGRVAAVRVDPDAGWAATRVMPASPGSWPATGRTSGEALDAVLGALAAAGVPVARVRPGRLVALRPGGAPDARAAAFDTLAARSEHTTRLAGAARPLDGFYSTFVVRRLSRPLTGVAVRLRATPNVVTLVSLAIGLASAWLLTSPDLLPRVAGAIGLQVSLVVDCVDGELARYTRRFTPLGAWLDGVGDRVKEYAVLAALALASGAAAGTAPLGLDPVGPVSRAGWLYALAGIVVMTYRHVADHHFLVLARAGDPPPAPGLAPETLLPRETPSVWARRVLQFPVGERWLLLSVLVVVAGARTTLAVFAVLAAASAVYTTGGRVLRSRRFAGPWSRRLRWLVPALRWVLEAAVVVGALAWRSPDRFWLGYVLVAVVAYHAYDTVYRAKHRVAGPGAAVRVASLAPEGRAVVVAVGALAGAGPLTSALTALAAWCAGLFGGESTWAWAQWLRTRPSIEEDA